VSLRISGADQGSLLSLKEWRNAHTAASTWLLDALLGQTQAILSEIKVEEWKFVENSGPRGVKTSLKDPEERMGYGLLLFQNEVSKDWAQEAFKKGG
jgi:hypothetical protein